MRIATQSHRVLFDPLNNFCQLLFFAGLSYLLSQVVAEGIIHQLHVVAYRMSKNLVSYLIHIFLYFLL